MMNEPHNCNPYLLRSTVLQLRTEDQEAELIRIRCEVMLQQHLWQLQHQQLQQDNQLLLMSLLQAGAAHAHTATQLQQLTQSSRLDTLTQTLNRSIMLDRIGQAISMATRQQSRFAVLFIDLDNFKQLNDKYGHKCGDYILKEFGDIIRSSIRSTDQAFRIGGDEFVVIVQGNIHAAGLLCERIVTATNANTSFHQFGVSSSLGAAEASDTMEAEQLYEQADKTLYQAKASGRNCYKLSPAQLS